MRIFRRVYLGRADSAPAPAASRALIGGANPGAAHASSAVGSGLRQEFLDQVAATLGRLPGEVDPAAAFGDTLGLRALELVDCLQIASEIWGVPTLHSGATLGAGGADQGDLLHRFPTLEAIMQEAERLSAAPN